MPSTTLFDEISLAKYCSIIPLLTTPSWPKITMVWRMETLSFVWMRVYISISVARRSPCHPQSRHLFANFGDGAVLRALSMIAKPIFRLFFSFLNKLSTAKPVPIRLVISRPNHRPIYQPTAHLSHITAVNEPADNTCGTAGRGGGCTCRTGRFCCRDK